MLSDMVHAAHASVRDLHGKLQVVLGRESAVRSCLAMLRRFPDLRVESRWLTPPTKGSDTRTLCVQLRIHGRSGSGGDKGRHRAVALRCAFGACEQ